MKRLKFSEPQIIFNIKHSQTTIYTLKTCRKMDISEATFYNWKKKYGVLGVSELRNLKNLEEETPC